jgi:hypothetical protein
MIKSSACRSESCVWVGYDATRDRVLVAIAEEPEAIRLAFTPEEWDTFVAGTVAGEFTMERLRANAATIAPASLTVGPAETDPFEDPEERAPWEDVGVPFHAQFRGSCDACGAEFYAGDKIRADGQGGWTALECCGEDNI